MTLLETFSSHTPNVLFAMIFPLITMLLEEFRQIPISSKRGPLNLIVNPLSLTSFAIMLTTIPDQLPSIMVVLLFSPTIETDLFMNTFS